MAADNCVDDCPRSLVRHTQSKMRDLLSTIRGPTPRSAVRGPASAVRGPRSEVGYLNLDLDVDLDVDVYVRLKQDWHGLGDEEGGVRPEA